jgi:2-aminoadipate transaminase
MSNFAQRMTTMENSAIIIKKLFSAMNDPEIISFGGGAPAKETLPVDIVREITDDIMRTEKRGIEALQYGSVIGLADLREVVINDLLAPKGVKGNVDNVMIINGGLEAMNLLCQLYINPGDIILVESPTFVHSFEIFNMFEAKCIAVDMDDKGMVPADLENKIKK